MLFPRAGCVIEGAIMNAAELISRLVRLEEAAGQLGDFVTRDFVIEAQDWILRAQRENLELLRENHLLRHRHEATRHERVQPATGHAAAPPLVLEVVGQSNRRASHRVGRTFGARRTRKSRCLHPSRHGSINERSSRLYRGGRGHLRSPQAAQIQGMELCNCLHQQGREPHQGSRKIS